MSGSKHSGTVLCFNDNRISVKPSKHVGDANGATEFVDDNVGVFAISIPKFRTRVFGIRFQSSFFPRQARFAGSSSSPVHANGSLKGNWEEIIFGDAFELVIATNFDVGGDFVKFSGFGRGKDSIPIVWAVAFERFVPQLKTGVGDSRFFFPNIGGRCIAAGRLDMGGGSENG